MRGTRSRYLAGASLAAICLANVGPGVAWAQAAPAATTSAAPQSSASGADQGASGGTTQVQEVVVTGVRASLRSAQTIKKNSDQIVDSVQADDIGKLPDANTVEALQRIAGVQIQRRYGEGGTDFDHRDVPAITVRGLTEVANYVDGRSAVSAAGGRTLDLEALSPELLAGIDVYKNPPANMIEGGVGGVVDIRTRLPFDAPGQLISTTIKGNYFDRADKYGDALSGLYSNRFQTGVGEMGVLLDASYSRNPYRQDALIIGAYGPIPAGTTIPGAPANAKVPYGEQIYDDGGDRKRLGIDAAFQWRPDDSLLITAQALLSHYRFYRQGKYYYYNNNGNSVTTPLNGAAFTFDSAGYATSGSLANQTFESARFDQDVTDNTGDFSLNAKWRPTDRFKMSVDLQYLKSKYDADRNGLVISLYDKTGETPYTSIHQSIVDFDLRGSTPRWDVRNPGLLSNPANYAFTYMADALQRNDADQLAFADDLEYDLEGGFFKKLRAGFRYADSTVDLRGTWNGFCLLPSGPVYSCSEAAGQAFVPATTYPQLVMAGPSPHFFDGNTLKGGILYPNFASGSSFWDSVTKSEALFGAKPKNYFAPGDLNHQTEQIVSGYLMTDYAGSLLSRKFDGTLGVRLVDTLAGSSGVIFNSDGTQAPLSVSKDYFKVLPSFDLRAHLTRTLQARLAFSESFTRPDFDQMSTNVTLNPVTQVNPIDGRPSGGSGNPYLRPITSTNYDATLEWYFTQTGSVTFGGFYKDVNGFLASGTVVRTFNGVAYDIGTTVNSGSGTIKGFEAAYQQFFDFLPGPLSGLGVQANYTFVDSNVTNPFAVAGSNVPTQVPLEKLSKNNYNLVGLYEKGPFTGRLAWNWRDKYLDTTYGSGANGLPQYQKPYATLDASFGVKLNSHISVSLDAVNILNRLNVTYINTPSQPLQYTMNDRRIGLSLRATY